MTKEKPSENLPGAGHNSKVLEEKIQKWAKELSGIDEQRGKLNKRAADIRAAAKEHGIDTDALRDVYGYWKKGRHEKDGYDESHGLCMEALNKMDQAELFGWQKAEKEKDDQNDEAGKRYKAAQDEKDRAAKNGENLDKPTAH